MIAVESSTIPIGHKRRRKLDLQDLWLRCQRTSHQFGLNVRWWLRPHSAYQPIFVVATQRSGSNLMVDYLNRLPGVQCHSEVLCTTLPYGLSRSQSKHGVAARHIRRSLHTLNTPVRGCKLMLDQLAACKLSPPALDKEFPEARYVILYRRSLAEQFLSRLTARATAQWYLLDGQQARQARVSVDPAELRSYCEAIRQSYRTILDHAWLPQRSVLLSYEELTADPEGCFADVIGPLLGVRVTRAETMLRKQNTLPLEQRVANYREVAALLHSSLCQQHYSWSQGRPLRRAA